MDLYHVLNRGVDKRRIFMNNDDRVRFVHDMYEFNDKAPANNTLRILQMNDFVSRSLREPIVEIHGWCLMDNHYHLLLSELVEGGITLFIRRLNIGYAKFFNEKYKRVGTLFQGRTKKILIDSDAHFLHILHYIHLNPLDFLKGAEDWRAREIRNSKDALQHLEDYRWSSYLDYCGKKNFPSVLTTGLFKDVFGNYQKTLSAYLKDITVETIKALTLE
ncbi:MAG: transposase [bacterium]|nr:transposase [bacterium]